MNKDWADRIDPSVHCPYPKHRGLRWDLVAERDPSYARWLISVDGPDTLTKEAAEAIEDALEALSASYTGSDIEP